MALNMPPLPGLPVGAPSGPPPGPLPSPSGAPPGLAAGPPPTPPPTAKTVTLAQASAMGTTQGAPAMGISKGPPGGSGLPGSGPPPPMPGQDPQPAPLAFGNARNGVAPPAAKPRAVVGPHRGQKSVGTHPSTPTKRGNPVHPFGK